MTDRKVVAGRTPPPVRLVPTVRDSNAGPHGASAAAALGQSGADDGLQAAFQQALYLVESAPSGFVVTYAAQRFSARLTAAEAALNPRRAAWVCDCAGMAMANTGSRPRRRE